MVGRWLADCLIPILIALSRILEVSRSISAISSLPDICLPLRQRILWYVLSEMDEERLGTLFSRVGQGDEAAERELHDVLRTRLGGIAFLRGIRGADLEDVVQEALSGTIEQLRRGTFKERSKPSSWVIRILLNKLADHFRNQERSEKLLAAATGSHGSSQLSRPNHQDIRIEVMQALARLTPTERFVLTSTELAGLTYEEVAGRLKCPPGTVASTKNRAVAKFREFFRSPAGAS
jgi:RNA polymerase sigma-70 factor, ECF subfamily